ADFNRDGRLDLAVANIGGATASILLGTGDGTFEAAKSYAVGAGPNSIAVGDFDGDGFPDLAVTNSFSSPGTISILLGKRRGTFQAGHNYADGSSAALGAAGKSYG